ncbi:MAG: hypothetical protein IJ418_19755 [Clostridia bacterium]|nr:hypothetical protein [Clostridia bacterium]
MGLNTTKSINRASTVLMGKCEKTEKDMKKLCAEAGFPDAKMVKTKIPNIPGCKDDVVFVGINGVKFYFLRGATVSVPENVLTVMEQSGIL